MVASTVKNGNDRLRKGNRRRHPILYFPVVTFLDLTVTGQVTQTSGFLRNTRIKATDFSKVSKFWKGLVNFYEVMVISWFLFLCAIMQYFCVWSRLEIFSANKGKFLR